MTQQATSPSITIERTINAPAEKIYKAFLDPATLTQFQTPEGTEAIYDAFTAKVGAENTYAFQSGDQRMTFHIKFLELNEFTLIRHSYIMAMPPPMDIEMEIRLHFTETDDGTVVRFEQYGIPEPVPVEHASAEYEKMMDRLKVLMES